MPNPVERDLNRRINALRERLNGVPPSNPEWASLLELTDELVSNLDQAHKDRELLERRIDELENSRTLQIVRAVGGSVHSGKRRLGHWLLHSPLHPLYLKLLGERASYDPAYAAWAEAEQAALPSWDWHRQECAKWSFLPLVSILIPVYEPNLEWLDATLESAVGQSYPNTEVCVAVDGPVTPDLRALFERRQVRWTESAQREGISVALNRAGAQSKGEYAAFLDHDDVLSPFALHCIVEALQTNRSGLLYTDEDWITAEGRRARPNFKPDWSPALLDSCMYMGHLLVAEREWLDQVGWFRSPYDGAQDYDLALRLTEAGASVGHIPRVLYHWRLHAASTAESATAKPWAHDAGRRARADAIGRRETNGAAAQAMSIVICSRTNSLLQRCLQSLRVTLGDIPHEIVVVHHQSESSDPIRPETLHGCVVVPYEREFNFSEMNNVGAAHAQHPVLLFLNDDVKALQSGWGRSLARALEGPNIAIAGAKLVYPSGAIQHAGLVLGMSDGIGHPGRGEFSSHYWRWLDTPRNVSAVTGACLAVRRSVFNALGGFDPVFPVNYNDVDLCLRARQAGYEVVYEPSAVLQHDECRTRQPGTRSKERQIFRERWGGRLSKPDPYYSPNLNLHTENITLSPIQA